MSITRRFTRRRLIVVIVLIAVSSSAAFDLWREDAVGLAAGDVVVVSSADISPPGSQVAAMSLSVTVANQRGSGYLVAYPCGSKLPPTSFANYTEHEGPVTSHVIVGVGDRDEVCIWTSQTTDVIVDVNGWFDRQSDWTFTSPTRQIDTRMPGSAVGRLPTDTVLAVPLPQMDQHRSAQSVVVGVTSVNASAGGFIQIFGCSDGATMPALNLDAPGKISSQSVIVPIEEGAVCVQSSVETDLLVDLYGWTTSTDDYVAASARMVDTRGHSERVAAGKSHRLPLPDDSAALVNVAVVAPDEAGWVALGTCGTPQTSQLTFSAGTTAATSALGGFGACLTASTGADVVVDRLGWLGASFNPTSPRRAVDTRLGDQGAFLQETAASPKPQEIPEPGDGGLTLEAKPNACPPRPSCRPASTSSSTTTAVPVPTTALPAAPTVATPATTASSAAPVSTSTVPTTTAPVTTTAAPAPTSSSPVAALPAPTSTAPASVAPAPRVDRVWPNLGPGATWREVYVDGAGFAPGAVVALGEGVNINQVVAVTASRITLKVSVPETSTAGPRTVTIAKDGTVTACSGCWTVNPKPVVNAVVPDTWAVGSTYTVEIDGTFSWGPTVAISGPGIQLTNLQVVSSSRLRVTVSVGAVAAPGQRELSVRNGDMGVVRVPVHVAGVSAESVTAPSGVPMPVGDLAGWRQVFTDDFTTDIPRGQFVASTSGQWKSYPSPWRDTSGNGLYAPDRVVSVSGGVLDKFLRTESDGTPLVAAIQPMNGKDLMYGRFEVRARMQPVEGYKVAWLLWPESRVWPRDGEIDFPERDLTDPRVHGFVHRQGATAGSDQAAFTRNIDATQWHTYTTEWSPNLVVFYLDGVEIGRTTERVPNTPMHWVIQTETVLSGVKPPASAAGHIEIDWVAIWAYDPG